MNFSAKFLFYRRNFNNVCILFLSAVATGFILILLGWILTSLISTGLKSMNWEIFTKMTPPPGIEGGLLNAMIGSFLMTLTATGIGAPIGIMVGIYLSEYGSEGTVAKIVRFSNGVLLSVPSVIIGFFTYALFVSHTRHFSGWAGAFALAVILIPIVTNCTENILKLVPNTLREAAIALGSPYWKVIVFICLRASKKGILTGLLLGIARISGETAPLLFTALNNQFWNIDMSKPMPNLPVTIFQFAMSPYEDWQRLAWSGALIITVAVLSINVFTRGIFKFQETRQRER